MDAAPPKAPSPFLKWAGGKRALVSTILPRFPETFETYIEPFLGAGSLFFSLAPEVRKIGSDYNEELISTYESIRDDLPEVLKELRKRVNTQEDYLAVREWDRAPTFAKRTKAARAARFIFLNKTGYNGLYRVNSKGQYNVPYGAPKTVNFMQEENLRLVSDFLNAKTEKGDSSVLLTSGDYRVALATAKRGDFVYLDPPYDPLSSTSAFTSYNENGFGRADQKELQREIVALTHRGVKVLLSNSDTEFIRDLYADPSIFEIETINVRRAISAQKSSRGVITEVLINNYDAVEG
jgi:DNA adenine methylase